MTGIQGVPVLPAAIAAAAGSVVFVWRGMSLMASRQQKFAVLQSLGIGAVFLVLIAGVKHNSAGHALLLFADMTVAFVGATLPVGKRFREVNTLTVETGVKHSLTKKEARFFAFLYVAILAVLLFAEYLLLY